MSHHHDASFPAGRRSFLKLMAAAAALGCEAPALPDGGADGARADGGESDGGDDAGTAIDAPGPAPTEPFPWYPALDLATIPFHREPGPWGARQPIQPAAAPNITGATIELTGAGADHNISNPPPGTQYVVAANVGNVTFSGAITDVELVIPSASRSGSSSSPAPSSASGRAARPWARTAAVKS